MHDSGADSVKKKGEKKKKKDWGPEENYFLNHLLFEIGVVWQWDSNW